MPEFKGFDDWFEVFAGGKHKCMRGIERDGDALIDKAIASFSPDLHEPPIVVGHPVTNAPAYGWISGIKEGKNGQGTRTLLVKAKQVEPQFAEMVKAGRFKKRSVSFNPDGTIRHIGFLGAAPPAVKGLQDLAFSQDTDAETFEFATSTERWAWGDLFQILRRLREHFLVTDGKAVANEVIPDHLLNDIEAASKTPETGTETGDPVPSFTEPSNDKEHTMPDETKLFEKFKTWLAADSGQANDGGTPTAQFSEADINAAVKQATEDAKAEAAAEFAEQQKAKKLAADKAKIAEFCESGIKEKTMAPAWVDAGIKQFMEQLAETPEAIQFAEGEDKKAPLDWFMDFMAQMPKLIDVNEFATRDKNVGGKDAGAQMENMVQNRMKENKDLTYAAAFAEVAQENRELAIAYQESMTVQ